MSHFAQIDENGVVQRVIVATQEFIDTGVLGKPSSFIQTSYNTSGGERIDPITKVKSKNGALRKNYAAVGFTYDKVRDAFIPPKEPNADFFDEEKGLWRDLTEELRIKTEAEADTVKK